jgi:ankyrin repeat protein
MSAQNRSLAILASAALCLAGVAGWHTPLLDAAAKGNVEAITKLLQSSDTDVEAKTDDGDTALILAARGGHARAAELLLDAEASADARNKDGDTAMLAAAKGGHLQVVELLLRKNVALDTANTAGDTALILAVEHRRGSVARLLIRKIEDVAVINAKNKAGRTALTCATRNGDAELEKLLRERGATQ